MPILPIAEGPSMQGPRTMKPGRYGRAYELTGGKGRVAMLTGILGAFDLEARMDGFRDAIEGTELEIVTTQACEDDINLSVEQVEQYTRSDPDLDAWFFVGGWPFFTPPESMEVLKEWKKGDKVLIFMDSSIHANTDADMADIMIQTGLLPDGL